MQILVETPSYTDVYAYVQPNTPRYALVSGMFWHSVAVSLA
jgi:hypothetical protein